MAYLTNDQIYTKLNELKTNYTDVEVLDLPNQTAKDNKTVKCLRIKKGSFPVLLVGGVHAREWAPPDALVEFAEKLLHAEKNNKPFIIPRLKMINPTKDVKHDNSNKDLVFGKKVYSKKHVKKILKKLDLYILPIANPDGRAFSMTAGNKMWRKNRRDYGSGIFGVDINRNFSMAWELQKYYDLASEPTVLASTSMTNTDDTYQGTSAESEPETKNISNLVTSKKVKVYMDVHSYAREILYPWSVNLDQTTDKSKTYLNKTLDRNLVTNIGGRPLKGASYKEYFPVSKGYNLLRKHKYVCALMKNSIRKAAGSQVRAKKRSTYTAKQSIGLYPTPGASDDWAFSTQLSDDGNKAKTNTQYPVFSFTIESGHESDGEFWPDPAKKQLDKVKREIHASVFALLRYSAFWLAK